MKLEIPSFGASLSPFSSHCNEESLVNYPLHVQSPVSRIWGGTEGGC